MISPEYDDCTTATYANDADSSIKLEDNIVKRQKSKSFKKRMRTKFDIKNNFVILSTPCIFLFILVKPTNP